MEAYIPQTPHEYMELFRKRKRLFLGFFLNVLLVTALAYPFLPRIYESAALVQVENARMVNPHVKGLTVSPGIEKTMKTLTAQIMGYSSVSSLARELGMNDQAMDKIKFEK